MAGYSPLSVQLNPSLMGGNTGITGGMWPSNQPPTPMYGSPSPQPPQSPFAAQMTAGQPPPPQAGAPPAAPAAAAPAATPPPPAASPLAPRPNMPQTAGLNDPRASAFFDLLMGKAKGSSDVSADDPTIKAQTDAYRAEQTRAGRSYLSQAAEAGGTNVNLDAQSRAVAEHGAQETSGFQANLISQERQARRNDIQQALSLGSGFLTQEQQMALQEELNQMDLQQRAYEFDTNQAYLESPFASGAGA